MGSLGCHTKVRQLLTGRKRRLLKSRPQSKPTLRQINQLIEALLSFWLPYLHSIRPISQLRCVQHAQACLCSQTTDRSLQPQIY